MLGPDACQVSRATSQRTFQAQNPRIPRQKIIQMTTPQRAVGSSDSVGLRPHSLYTEHGIE